MNFKDVLNEDVEYINSHLLDFLPTAKDGQDSVIDAARYSLENGGKRIRPVLCLEFAKAFGCKKEDALNYACAVEFIHTYSLIHDDLPCMDNDDLRRGKPSCHIAFGESTALLAGDLLLTEAFGLICKSNLSAEQNSKAVIELSKCAGGLGMIGGQVIDLLYESKSPNIEQIKSVHKLKTGALLESACVLGCIAANADEKTILLAKEYAHDIGMAFQIKDDILDIIGNSDKMGKPTGSDKSNSKTTYVSLKGIENSSNDVVGYTAKAVSAVEKIDSNGILTYIANYLAERDY